VFLGEVEHKIDEKGRVMLPAQFRRDLREGVVLTPGVESCITAYPLAEWKKIAAALTGGSVTHNKLRKLNRAIFATASKVVLDGQGRVVLPLVLREYAGIEDEVVIVGANSYFELWNRAQWEAEKADSQDQAWQIIETLDR